MMDGSWKKDVLSAEKSTVPSKKQQGMKAKKPLRRDFCRPGEATERTR
jgi:hypothetical protein